MTLDYIPAGEDAPIIDSGEAAAAFWRERVMATPQFNADNEWSIALLLDKDLRLLGHVEPRSDGAQGWVANPLRRTMRAVLVSEAAGICLVHNHPVGPVDASDADRNVAHTFARWLEELGGALFDYVIVDRSGQAWNSFAESGELEYRAEAKREVRAKNTVESIGALLDCMYATDGRLRPCVSEAANLAGVSIEQWSADFMLAKLLEHFTPNPVEDRRLCYAGAFMGKYPDLQQFLLDESGRAGIGLTHFIWERSQEAFAEHLRALQRSKGA